MIVVTGLMRSGTTPLAMMLHQMGVRMGNTMRFPEHTGHPHLEWEDAGFSDRLIEAILHPATDVAEILEEYVAFRAKEERTIWGVKTPFLMPFMSEFRRACHNASEGCLTILTHREYADTVASLERQMDHVDDARVRDWMLSAQERLAASWEAVARDAEIFDFKDTQEDPRGTAARLAQWVGISDPNLDVALTGIGQGYL